MTLARKVFNNNDGSTNLLKKIISGGQTGSDRAALDIAIKIGIKHGGWCPKGRSAEDGAIAKKYHLIETKSKNIAQRTKKNIKTSDATLVFVPQLPLEITDGTKLTIKYAQALLKPLFIVDLANCKKINEEFYSWLKKNNISILNVAGPRESSVEGIYQKTYDKFAEMMDFAIKMLRT
jgi:hypothetical protein